MEISSAHLFPVGYSDECSSEEENDGYLKRASRSPGQCREASELPRRNRHERVSGIGPPERFRDLGFRWRWNGCLRGCRGGVRRRWWLW